MQQPTRVEPLQRAESGGWPDRGESALGISMTQPRPGSAGAGAGAETRVEPRVETVQPVVVNPMMYQPRPGQHVVEATLVRQDRE